MNEHASDHWVHDDVGSRAPRMSVVMMIERDERRVSR